MQSVNINNVSSEFKSKKANSYYLAGLKGTWAFSVKLNNYSIPFKILILLFRLLTFVFYSVFYLLKMIFFLIVSIAKQSRASMICVIVVLVLLIVGLFDFVINYGKVYPGVYVGDLDLSGKTAEEAEKLIDDTFSARLTGNNVVIYVSEEAQAAGQNDEGGSGISEQLSVEQARETVKYWKTNSVELEANLPTKDLLDSALNSTRGLLNIPKRLGALIFKQIIAPYADYNESAVLDQINRVNDTIGKPVINPTCVIEDASSYAVDGSDGNLVNNQEFYDNLNTAFFQKNSEDSNFVPKLYRAKQNVSFQSAQILSDKINYALDKKVHFSYKDKAWDVDRINLSSWINIEIENHSDDNSQGCACSNLSGGNYSISARVDSNRAGMDILSYTRDEAQNFGDYSIKFVSAGDNVSVVTDGDFEMPSISDAVEQLNNEWLENAVVYENNKNSNKNTGDGSDCSINIGSSKVPERLSLQEAINIGVVTTISTYTTTYSSGAGTENRNSNIALAAASINNSICEANGGRWSFNETVGDTTVDRGYLEAGSIVGNKYTKSIGGGVCQVATTVFNTIYDSGFQVVSRHNHDLHMASYPAGRDAAISYPYLDLIWQNNESSDVLMRTNTTGYSVTVDMLGVNPQYSVVTEVGQWVEGEHYATENVVDPAKEPNSKTTQTSGSDGKSITIKRKVYDNNGNLVREEEYNSLYKPKTEIIVFGPGDEANKMLAEHTARMKDETDNW